MLLSGANWDCGCRHHACPKQRLSSLPAHCCTGHLLHSAAAAAPRNPHSMLAVIAPVLAEGPPGFCKPTHVGNHALSCSMSCMHPGLGRDMKGIGACCPMPLLRNRHRFFGACFASRLRDVFHAPELFENPCLPAAHAFPEGEHAPVV